MALQMAKKFFGDSDIPWASFHTFRREAGTVALKQREENEPDIYEDTGSLLSAEDIETLESFDEGTSGYFGKMLRWLENFIKNGTEEGRFTEKQAHQDLLLALWYAFACNNLDDYIHYYHAAEWMKDSEKSAAGCATWYYRYSVALMYCGRRSTPEPPWNRWSTIGSTPMPTKRSSRDWTRMRTINSAPWLRQLKNRLDSGEWLPHTPEGESEGTLIAVFVDQTRRIGLVYRQPEADQYFQVFLNPDGTKTDAIWSSGESSEPEAYTEEEMEAVERHIQQYFGKSENVFHELVSPDIHAG